MGLFSRLFGRPTPKIVNVAQLRVELFRAAAARNRSLIRSLAAEYRDMLLQDYGTWNRMDPAVPANERAQYVDTLVTLARCLNDLGYGKLLEVLTAPDKGPMAGWEDRIATAHRLTNSGDYGQAATVLTELMPEFAGCDGTGVTRYQSIATGLLGQCQFHTGDARAALVASREALRLCEAGGDAEGVEAYLGNLYEICRYLGDGEGAAGYAERLADTYARSGRRDDADDFARRAAASRRGEPLCRVLAVVNGRRYEVEDMDRIRDGRVQFVFELNHPTLRPSQLLVAKGEQLGSQSRYDEALDAFREAAKADSRNPQAPYEEGLTLLFLKRCAEAAECFARTEQLAPGWYHCRSDRWTALHLQAGNLSHEAFVASREIEDGTASPKEKVVLAERSIALAPSWPLLHLLLGNCLAKVGRTPEAARAYATGLQSAEEPDVRTRLLLALATASGTADSDKTRLLREAAMLNGNLVAAAMARCGCRSNSAVVAVERCNT